MVSLFSSLVRICPDHVVFRRELQLRIRRFCRWRALSASVLSSPETIDDCSLLRYIDWTFYAIITLDCISFVIKFISFPSQFVRRDVGFMAECGILCHGSGRLNLCCSLPLPVTVSSVRPPTSSTTSRLSKPADVIGLKRFFLSCAEAFRYYLL